MCNIGGMILTANTAVLGEKNVSIQIYPLQITLKLI